MLFSRIGTTVDSIVTMPRLGSDDEEEGIPLVGQPFGNRRREREATAYAASGHGSFHKLEALKLLSVLVGFLVVRNMLSHVSSFFAVIVCCQKNILLNRRDLLFSSLLLLPP